jgi:hypothetical protein
MYSVTMKGGLANDHLTSYSSAHVRVVKASPNKADNALVLHALAHLEIMIR